MSSLSSETVYHFYRMASHDFRPPKMTREQFAARLKQVVDFLKRDPVYHQLTWNNRKNLNAIEFEFEQMSDNPDLAQGPSDRPVLHDEK